MKKKKHGLSARRESRGKKSEIMTILRVKELRHSETIFAKKRYTLTPLFHTISRVKEPPSFRNHFSQRKVYLNTSIVAINSIEILKRETIGQCDDFRLLACLLQNFI